MTPLHSRLISLHRLGRQLAGLPLETRDPALQAEIDRTRSHLSVYHFSSCPYCLRVRRTMRRLGLHIELRNIHGDPQAKQELLQGGGKVQVPCLRIEQNDNTVTWLYESTDIVRCLEKCFPF